MIAQYKNVGVDLSHLGKFSIRHIIIKIDHHVGLAKAVALAMSDLMAAEHAIEDVDTANSQRLKRAGEKG